MKLSGEATTRMIIEGQPEWRADASFDGDLDKLPLTGKLQEPFRADMRGELLTLSSNFHWPARPTSTTSTCRRSAAASALGIVTGTLDIGGEMNDFHARGPLMVPGLGAGLFDLVFEGNYADRVVNATHYEVTHQATGSHVEGQGTIEPAENGPKLLLAGDWRGCAGRWRRASPRRLRSSSRSPAGQLPPRRCCGPMRITASGDLYVPQLDPMTVAMRGALHKDHLQIDELDLGAFGGKAHARRRGALESRRELGARRQRARDSIPAELRPGFNGALDFNMKASGAPFGGDGTLDFASAISPASCAATPRAAAAASCSQGEDWTFDEAALPRGHHQPRDRRQHRRHRAR